MRRLSALQALMCIIITGSTVAMAICSKNNVLERYHADFRAEGEHSYDYKIESGRLNK